jgi:hypothetical protein
LRGQRFWICSGGGDDGHRGEGFLLREDDQSRWKARLPSQPLTSGAR